MFTSGRQLTAARGLAGLTIEKLSELSGMSREAILKIENGAVTPRAGSKADITKALLREGVEFTENEGVRRRTDILRVIEGEDFYLKVLEDVFFTLKDTKGEVLFSFVRNELSPPEVIKSDLRLRDLGIRFRHLIEEGDTYCLYPLREYRTIPSRFFHNNTQIIYGQKYASMIDENKKAFIINDFAFTETQRKTFEIFWSTGHMPDKTRVLETYE